MMLITTLFIAAIIIAAIYFVLVRSIRHASISYAIMLAVGLGCFLLGSVHFWFVGIEVAGIGSLVVRMHYSGGRKSAGEPSTRAK